MISYTNHIQTREIRIELLYKEKRFISVMCYYYYYYGMEFRLIGLYQPFIWSLQSLLCILTFKGRFAIGITKILAIKSTNLPQF